MCHKLLYFQSLALAQANSIFLVWDSGRTWRPYWFFHSTNFHHDCYLWVPKDNISSPTTGPLKSTPVQHRGSFRSRGMHSSTSCPLLHMLGHRPTVLLLFAPPQKLIWLPPLWNWIFKLSSYSVVVVFSDWRTLRSFMFCKETITVKEFALLYKQDTTFWALQLTKILKCTVRGFKK